MVFGHRSVTCEIATLFVVSLVGIANAEPPAYESTVVPTAATVPLQAVTRTVASPAEEIVFGDRYTIDVERAGMRQRFDGEMVKVTDKWFVLRRVTETRNEFGVPVMNKVPYVNRLFKNVGIGRSVDYLWIPREAAEIAGHVRPEVAQDLTNIAEEAPPAGHGCTTVCAEDEKIVERPGKITGFENETLVLSCTRRTYEVTKVPMLGDLPFVGSAFRKTRAITEIVREEIPRDKILCLRLPVDEWLESPAEED